MTNQTSPVSETLKPCPFCGSADIREGICYVEGMAGVGAAVQCAGCGVRGLRDAWNQRFEFAQTPAEPKVILMLKIIDAAGGVVACDDSPHSWLNYFCDDYHPTDTFNQAVDAKFLRVTHDNRFDASTAYLTEAGRAALSNTSTDREGK